MEELTAATLDWSGVDKPIAVTNVDILAAMAETDPNESKGARTRYVEFGGHEYPLKHVVERALVRAGGPETSTFHSDRAEDLVEELGFEAVRRDG